MSGRFITLGDFAFFNLLTYSANTSAVLDSTTKKIAYLYTPKTTSPITDVSTQVNVVGTPGTFKFGIFECDTTAAERPGSTQVGGYTPGFSLTNGVWCAWQTLSSNTGNLVAGRDYWVVLEYDAGTCDASNYLRSIYRYGTANNYLMHGAMQYYTTSWQGITRNQAGEYFVKHQDGSIDGFGTPFDNGGTSTSPYNDIYVSSGVSQVQGIRFRVGSKCTVGGSRAILYKNGSPGLLTLKLYEGDTERASVTLTTHYQIPAASGIVSRDYLFTSPYTVEPDTDCYLIFSQDGTSNSNDFSIMTNTYSTAPTGVPPVSSVPSRFAMVYGNGTTPSSYSVSTTEFPFMLPLILNYETDLDSYENSSGGVQSAPLLGGVLQCV